MVIYERGLQTSEAKPIFDYDDYFDYFCMTRFTDKEKKLMSMLTNKERLLIARVLPSNEAYL